MTPEILAPVANHLWQSTMFAAVAAGVALLLRQHSAAARYRIWLAASLKFLVPFSLLAELGSRISWSLPANAIPPAANLVAQVSEPFVENPDPLLLGTGNASQSGEWLLAAVGCWLLVAVALALRSILAWFKVGAIARAAEPMELGAPIALAATDAPLEPGVFGIIRPVLLIPRAILAQLSPVQLRAILAHELCHVRRRDNLASALHMAVETMFWFHPLVWWIGARLVEEREHACDEEVLRQGSDPETYAEGILAVCRMSLESPLPCMSGVTGADLYRRIEAIMSGQPVASLSKAGRATLAAAAACAIGAPVFLGIVKAAQSPAAAASAMTFDIASIRENKSGDGSSRFGPGPGGGIRAVNVNAMQLLTFAYDVKNFQVTNAPGWVQADRYDILAKPERPDGPTDIQTMNDKQRLDHMNQMRLRVRGMLADRFGLAVRKDKKDLPYYALVLAKGGAKLTQSKNGEFSNQHMRNRRGSLEGERVTTQMIVNSLSNQLDRTVVDETGLTGTYDFTLTWDPTGDDGGASLFSAIQEQLGLKLESKKGPVDVLVIDKISKPSEN